MRYDLASITDRGGRSENEDRLAVWNTGHLLAGVVADGAGGHGGGGVAAQLTVDTSLDAIKRISAQAECADAARLEKTLREANRAIVMAQARGGALAHMRSTAAVLAIDRLRGIASCAHCGDTRIYCFRQGRTALQTADHSMVQGLVDAKLLAPHDVRDHPQRNVLLDALGTNDELRIAVVEPFAIADGDVFLVCTDGLWGYIDEMSMIDVIGHAADAAAWLAMLRERVRRVAPCGADNLTAIAVWVGEPHQTTIIAWPDVRGDANARR